MTNLNDFSALYNSQYYGDQSNYQKDMDNASCIISDKTYQPTYNEDDGNNVQ